MYFWVQQTTEHYVNKTGCECRFMYCQYNNMYINNQGWIPQPASWMTHDCTKIWTMWANILPPDTRQDSVWFKVGIKHQISMRLTPTTGRQFQTLPARKLFMEIFSTTACTHTHLHAHTVWTEYYFDIARGVMQYFFEGALTASAGHLEKKKINKKKGRKEEKLYKILPILILYIIIIYYYVSWII